MSKKIYYVNNISTKILYLVGYFHKNTLKLMVVHHHDINLVEYFHNNIITNIFNKNCNITFWQMK